MFLEIVWLIIVSLNTIPFVSYILYMKSITEKRPWNIKIDPAYEPNISILIPTYNESNTIEGKLENLFEVDYPKDKMEIIIIDSASNDGTPEIIRKWIKQHSQVEMNLFEEKVRGGMIKALNIGLNHCNGEVIIKTDADCLLLKDSLKNAIKYLADPNVGSVAGLHIIKASKETSSVKTERTYRKFYRWLRIGESKLYSTVLYEGELMLVKHEILDKIKFDDEIGADDVPTALRISEQGYRAITGEDAYFVEHTPYTWKEKFRQKIRRARHIFQALWKYKYLIFHGETPFHRLILPFETYIYVVNPVITALLVVLSAIMVARHPLLLTLALLLLIEKIRRIFITHLVNNLTMLIAIFKEAIKKENVTWRKIEEIREHA